MWHLPISLLAMNCFLLITFANSLDPDQYQQNVSPDLDPNSLTLDSVPERIFVKKLYNFEKKMTKKSWKITQHAVKILKIDMWLVANRLSLATAEVSFVTVRGTEMIMTRLAEQSLFLLYHLSHIQPLLFCVLIKIVVLLSTYNTCFGWEIRKLFWITPFLVLSEELSRCLTVRQRIITFTWVIWLYHTDSS